MQVFYAPNINGESYILDERESKHVVRVLRMGKNDPVKLIDGKGSLYEGVIVEDNKERCVIGIISVTPNFEKRNYQLHIAISPLKNPDRFEWFIEKAVEIGVDIITPLICDHTEKQSIKPERINNIIISAMKQSLKSKSTILGEPCGFDKFIATKTGGTLMIAHCEKEFERLNVVDAYKSGENAVILIGPEGDFSVEEIKKAVDSGFKPIHLGTSRLRTETAGIAACHSIYFLNQNR